ncbi:MAG TPA: ATP-dependent RNA helicase RhlB, partial [Gammaproteobacteria bacterium]|nr:ATP-dependent RNA helicase RhlB [Gammaproteobacteria bacterium]
MQQESNNEAGSLDAASVEEKAAATESVQEPMVTSFKELDLHPQLSKAIKAMGFDAPTPIQAQTLPFTLKGADIIGQAQTGTGKTAAFLISAIQHMLTNTYEEERFNGEPRLLVLAPTRELVMQIAADAENLCKFTGFNILTLIGGVDYDKQRDVLHNELVDILVATPGRLIDFLRSRDVDLREVEVLVLDEADRMLDMGFISDVRRIVHATPHKPFRQTLFFSATFTEDTNRLAQSWTLYPHEVRIESEQLTADTVEHITYLVTDEEKLKLLYNLLVREDWRKVIVFTNRRDETRALFEKLEELGLPAAMMSGEIDQRKRIKTIEKFKNGEIQVLVATDVAGRGLHVDDVSQVVNYALPETPDDYVHRIGRTG